MPLLALVWIVSFYDALVVSLDEVKKEPWLKRLSYARNRVRLKGWGDTVLKRAKLTVPLLVLLVFAVYAGSYFIHADDYRTYARRIGSALSERGMAVVPGMIDRILKEYS
jgi:hypothetical protein